MSVIIPYVARRELDAAEQVKQFIAYCRDELTIFADRDPSFDWSADTWDITKNEPLAGSQSQSNTICWTRWPHSEHAGEPMTQPFGDFARAWCCHLYGEESNPITNKSGFRKFDGHLTTLRVLEQALIDLSPDGTARIERLTADVLDRTMELARGAYKSTTMHSFGAGVTKLNRFLKRKRLVAEDNDWVNPERPPKRERTDKAIKEHRNKRLPTEAAIYALADIFKVAETPVDRIITAVAWILGSAPDRVAEVADLRAECTEWRTLPDRAELVIRLWPVKGGEPTIKPIPEAFTDVVLEAVKRLRELSEEGRAMARWYESNPTQLYLPPHLDHLRDQEWLTKEQTLELLGVSSANYLSRVNRYAKNKTSQPIIYGEPDPDFVSMRKGKGSANRPFRYRFADVERYLLNLLPACFRSERKDEFGFAIPLSKTKYSDCMLVFPWGTFGNNRRPSPCLFEKIGRADIADHLGPSETRRKNIFERHGKRDAAGKPLFIRTHSFRHWLTTMAEAVMTPIENNQWRGTAVASHIDAYLHNTAGELAEMAGLDPKAPTRNRFDNDLPAVVPWDIDEAKREVTLRRLLGHPTELGWCGNDYIQEPCQNFQRCMKCDQHVCVVGDEKRCQRVKDNLVLEQTMLNNALEDLGEGYDGTDRWIEHKKENVARLTAIDGVLSDPTQPKGTVLRMNGVPLSPFQIAARKRAEATDNALDHHLAEVVAPAPPRAIGE